MADRPLLHRIHNPRNYECGCDPDCWCRRTAIGRAAKWWFPARWFGIRHKNSFFDGMTWDEIREWKRKQEDKDLYPMVVQPRYEKIVRLGLRRWGITVRRPDGRVASGSERDPRYATVPLLAVGCGRRPRLVGLAPANTTTPGPAVPGRQLTRTGEHRPQTHAAKLPLLNGVRLSGGHQGAS